MSIGAAAGQQAAEPGCGLDEDIGSYWTSWFEHDREGILAEHFEATGRPGRPALPAAMLAETVFPLLTKYATSSDAREREAAALALGRAGTPRAVWLLRERLGDADPGVARSALLALGLTGEAEALGAILDRLAKPPRTGAAALALGLLGREEARPALLAAWRALGPEPPWNPGGSEAYCLALALGALGGPGTVEDLAAPLRRRDDQRRTPAICEALGRIGGDRALDELLHVRERCLDRGMRAAAVGALGRFRGNRRAAEFLLGLGGLRSGDRRTKIRAMVSVGRVVAPLDEWDPIRRGAERELLDISTRVLRDRYESMSGPLGLAFLGSLGAVPLLLSRLGTAGDGGLSETYLRAAAISLALLGRREAIPGLRTILAGDSSWECRGDVALALGILGDPESREAVRAAMARPGARPEFLAPAARALGLLGDFRDTNLLVDLLERDDRSFTAARAAAARAIGMIGDPAAAVRLATLLDANPDCRTSAHALAALGSLADRDRFHRLSRFRAGLNWWDEPEILRTGER